MKLHRNFHRRQRAGFSLAEMMVVIVIIGLLATLVVPNVIRNLGTATKSKVKSDITAIASAIDNYTIENGGAYPDSLDQLVSPPDGGLSYLKGKTVPKDPWKMEYMYDPPSVTGTGTYKVYTFGRDKNPGGEGDDADISNLTILGEEE